MDTILRYYHSALAELLFISVVKYEAFTLPGQTGSTSISADFVCGDRIRLSHVIRGINQLLVMS